MAGRLATEEVEPTALGSNAFRNDVELDDGGGHATLSGLKRVAHNMRGRSIQACSLDFVDAPVQERGGGFVFRD